MNSKILFTALIFWLPSFAFATASGQYTCSTTFNGEFINASHVGDSLNIMNCDTSKPFSVTPDWINSHSDANVLFIVCCVQK
jgi:hypothetical protein